MAELESRTVTPAVTGTSDRRPLGVRLDSEVTDSRVRVGHWRLQVAGDAGPGRVPGRAWVRPDHVTACHNSAQAGWPQWLPCPGRRVLAGPLGPVGVGHALHAIFKFHLEAWRPGRLRMSVSQMVGMSLRQLVSNHLESWPHDQKHRYTSIYIDTPCI